VQMSRKQIRAWN